MLDTERDPGDRTGLKTETDDADSDRQQAIRRIEWRRHFHIELAVSCIAVAFLVVIWAISEYHDAGGWPIHGFGQSSGVHDVWNIWIIYPVIGIALFVASRAWFTYGYRPASESEIEREMERQKDEQQREQHPD